MKAKDVRDLTAEELEKELQERKQELFNLRLQSRTGQLENTARVRTVKRTIARLLTIKKEAAKNEG